MEDHGRAVTGKHHGTKKAEKGKFMGTEFKDEIEGLIDKRSQAYTDISDAIWGFAEPRFQEREPRGFSRSI